MVPSGGFLFEELPHHLLLNVASSKIVVLIEVCWDNTDMKRPILKKKFEIIRGFTIKYHANGKTIWSKGKIKDGKPDGYWEWYRPNGTLKRSGTFKNGEPAGEWITYDSKGKVYKVTQKKKAT
jgi:antitoxin component YwqK of YwqJK toxin-antitoxin module